MLVRASIFVCLLHHWALSPTGSDLGLFFCILVIYLSMSFIHQSLQKLSKLVTTRQFMESDALVKFLGGNGLVNEFDIYLFMN